MKIDFFENEKMIKKWSVDIPIVSAAMYHQLLGWLREKRFERRIWMYPVNPSDYPSKHKALYLRFNTIDLLAPFVGDRWEEIPGLLPGDDNVPALVVRYDICENTDTITVMEVILDDSLMYPEQKIELGYYTVMSVLGQYTSSLDAFRFIEWCKSHEIAVYKDVKVHA